MKIALIGNPNCGKTTLFNKLTGSSQYVGNWPGVTVEMQLGTIEKNMFLVDLPGIYSLSPYTPEEIIARKYITEHKPDVIVNIVDASNLERNLYLTTQLLELEIPMVIALNMMDVIKSRGEDINISDLEKSFNTKIIEISALKGWGYQNLISAIKHAKSKPTPILVRNSEARYLTISKLVNQIYTPRASFPNLSDKIDSILTNRYLALPIFAFFMWFIYYVSISIIGRSNLINLQFVDEIILALDLPTWLNSLILDGIVAGVGSVLGFVPQLFFLFFFLSILEDCGYMARVAFIMDKIFCGFGLSGKSFIPMLLSSGCGVPGILASRTIESEKERKLTIMTTTFIPCGAKLPIIALISGTFFPNQNWIAPSAYFLGIGAVALSGILLKNSRIFKFEASPYIMELPAYHMPHTKNLLIHVWIRIKAFIMKAGSVILLTSAIIWFLSNFNIKLEFSPTSDSILAEFGRFLTPIFTPLGFGSWQAVVACLTGLIAKENIVSTLNILLGSQNLSYLFSPASAYSFMAFNLLCAPCIAAVSAMKKELHSLKWTFFSVLYQTLFAYFISFILYRLLHYIL